MKTIAKLLAFGLAASMIVAMPSCKSKASAKGKQKKEAKAPSKFDKTVMGAKAQQGPFTVYMTKKNKVYFALPDSVFTKDYLLSSRIAGTSDTREVVAGQMSVSPFLIRFSKDSANVYLHEGQATNKVRKGDPIESSFKINFLDPILKAFPIIDTQDGKVLIDVTDFFSTDEKCITPLTISANPRSRAIKGSLVRGSSSVTNVKSFPLNVEIKSVLTYSTQPYYSPYTLEVQRSILELPKNPVMPRLQDNRVGYFSSGCRLFTTDKDKIDTYKIVHRWDLQPKDSAAYFRGELVEPIKPIIFYVDSAFPAKWMGIVKQGIEDWNRAFEAAGFKNAIIAKDFPKDDPNFDPDDIRYSCVRYATTPTANAMGPSYVDPRSGEIICANVIWYHNVLSLVHNWRFVQTGAVDPRVRKETFDDDVMRQSLRYVMSHEIGHTLGLMHNMGASYSYTIDSLRSPSFTKVYGTTPSIMDYARNNFVAQPGDYERGVCLTPPILGVYDINAIRWAYKLIPDAKTPQDEVPTLNAWIAAKADDPMYEFGAQQFPTVIDPTDQTEDLSNDHFTAGDMSISNLKIIAKNIPNWLVQKDKRYDDIQNTYLELLLQYRRHLGHVIPYIGGMIFKENRQGDKFDAYTFVPKAKQQKAIDWLVNQARTLGDWLFTPEQVALMSNGTLSHMPGTMRNFIIQGLYNPAAMNRIYNSELKGGKDAYKLADYVSDLTNKVFEKSKKGAKLSEADKDIESKAISMMLSESNLVNDKKSGARSIVESVDELAALSEKDAMPCALGATEVAENIDADSFFRPTMLYRSIDSNIIAPLWINALKQVKNIYNSRRASGDSAQKAFYQYQILRIDNALSGKNL
ncbi:zinc-dependent metalloprotease [Falsiporphyromonas endometrii]|uniref:Zinc-dependent metalloprotease n=1 Tax=Falsiporphyromonas endometrii TaxID=1387297 RepID=A0ABV9K6A4_9PORP